VVFQIISAILLRIIDSWEFVFGVVPWDILKMVAANFSRCHCYITKKHGVISPKTVVFIDCHFQRKDYDGRVALPDTCE